MRVIVKVQVDVEKGNEAIKNGKLPMIMKAFHEKWKPEASYFISEDGMRTALIVINMADTAQIPSIAEPFFMGLNADVTLIPAMNLEDLGRGLPLAEGDFSKW